ncbi:LytTR family DNA-binding domain-containing protein [Aquimarina sp. RZ0]|uniref:LytR/AlgR family response regulator transcription factor n=1 Tax=Aquimarina sp. RZ0 TaxID=2607730 RepID=UPI0011F31329|nr:LytTR family DNA-binding domain-containing protein [Aquimarina sp. RZ0]KAA1248014.1 response regulator transcription factor [Aquimarina sp. RZ0]
MIKCLILEDEKSAQKVLKNYIKKTPFLECIGIYETGLNIPIAELQKIDVLFLDIQLPELNGLSFLKTISNPPKVIVTTAFPNYAIEAFEEAVVDYLLKPFSYERFFKAVTRVRNDAIHQNKEVDKNLFLYSDKTLYKINADDVLFLKAEVDYVNVVTEEKNILILDSLRNWNEKLQNFRFIQVHRSYIINIDKIKKIYGNQVFISDKAIPIGKTYKDDFLKKIK